MSLVESICRSGLSCTRWAVMVLALLFVASPALAAEGFVPAGHRHQLQPVHSTVAVVYCLAIVLASVFGGVMPKLVTLTHGRLQLLISYVGGLMLGISVFHLLPHAMVELGGQRIDGAMIALMCGMVAMFLLLRMFHFHDHGTAEVPDPLGHDHDHDGGHCGPAFVPLEVAHSHGEKPHRELSWMGVCFGLSVHSLLDGMALGASMQAGTHSPGVIWVGFGTFLAILLHKPLDSVSIAVLMREGKCPSNWRLAVNLLYSLMCPLGAIVFLLGFSGWTGQHPEVVGYTLAFAAGVFLCISLGDLLPEMEFHSHHRVQLTAALLAGIVTAWFIRMAEETGAHDMSRPPADVVARNSFRSVGNETGTE
jgi:zinc and cadmium transporter